MIEFTDFDQLTRGSWYLVKRVNYFTEQEELLIGKFLGVEGFDHREGYRLLKLNNKTIFRIKDGMGTMIQLFGIPTNMTPIEYFSTYYPELVL